MKLFLEDNEVEEIKPINPSNDHGLVHTPNRPIVVTERQERPSDIAKEMIGLDTLEMTTREAGKLHGVDHTTAAKYAKGEQVNPDIRAKILGRKYEIEDLAVTRLMDTLNILDPQDLVKPSDKISLLNSLSNVVSRITDQKNDRNTQQVILHLYGPKQNKESDYETIDV